MEISLIIPIKDESVSLAALIASIKRQSFPPAEIILVDGGSTDNTTKIAEELIADDARFKLIKTPEASPGKGRNIGVESAQNEWIAFTDAGIILETNWLEKLVEQVQIDPKVAVVYGNYSPVTNNLFEKCAALAYVAPQGKATIRGKFIASSLMKREVWEKVGGFPDLRAAEDLIYMEAVESHKYQTAFAPAAKVNWQLRSNSISTFQKFVLYSKHNALAGRQWDWHYGTAKYYFPLIAFIILIVVHSWWWMIAIVLWIFARSARRILVHRYEFGIAPLFNPLTFTGVALMILLIDIATFVGWGRAILTAKK